MLELDIRIDTDLRDRAVTAVEAFVKAHGTPVSRSQIAGLLQIAGNEPNLIAKFADNQKQRAEKRLNGMRDGPNRTRLESEVEFWRLVTSLSAGTQGNIPWSLAKQYQSEIPAELQCNRPASSAPREEHDRYQRIRSEREAWVRQWTRDYYPAFFRHFCAEYLCRMPSE